MIDQARKSWVATNRCKDAFNAKSNPNRPSAAKAEQADESPANDKPYSKRSDPRPARAPLTADQRELVERYLPLAYALAKKRNVKRMKLGGSDEINDLKAAASMALVETAGTFDPTRGVYFAVYARRRIEGSLINLERVLLWHNWRGDLADRPRFGKLSLGSERHGRVLYVQEADPVGSWLDAIDEVEGSLRKLPKLHAEACRLVYLEGKSQDEAAGVLGYSKSYFSRLHQAALSRIVIGA